MIYSTGEDSLLSMVLQWLEYKWHPFDIFCFVSSLLVAEVGGHPDKLATDTNKTKAGQNRNVKSLFFHTAILPCLNGGR